MRIRNFIFVVFALAVGAGLFGTATPARAIISSTLSLSQQDMDDLKRMQAHLNSAKTIQARFLQVSSNGDYTEGSIALERPGRLNLTYDAPNPLKVIADGTYISYIDRELDQATTLPIGWTRAELLLRESFSFFGKDLMVTGFERSPGVLRVSLVKADEPLEGNLTLIFSDRPLEIRKWVVTDDQGITTTVSLLGPSFNVKFDKKLFYYKPPTIEKESK
jgi:outer membrane lipoprotein-sorting protein